VEKTRILRYPILILALLVAGRSLVQAQATRTWVSGVGDDANPCSRTAPCKTFAGAISKTTTAGEINVLDPGGFGAVTITKSIAISSEGFEAGVLVTGTNGIIVNAPVDAVVVIRGLDIEGLGTGLAGINVLQAGSVHVENCTINNFTQRGIDFNPSATSTTYCRLHVSNTIIRNCLGSSSGGIHIRPQANVFAIASIENTELRNNSFGVRVEDRSQVIAKNSIAASSTGSGFLVVSNVVAAALNLDGCVAIGNGVGIRAAYPYATARFANCTLSGNTLGIDAVGGGHTVTFTDSNNNADPGIATDSLARQ
jgi:hypothetical protein